MPTLSTLILLAQWGLWACQTIMAPQSDKAERSQPCSLRRSLCLSQPAPESVRSWSALSFCCQLCQCTPSATEDRPLWARGQEQVQKPAMETVGEGKGGTSLALRPHLLSSPWGPHQTFAQSRSPRALISSICLTPLCGRRIQGWHRQSSRYISDTRRNSKHGRDRKS